MKLRALEAFVEDHFGCFRCTEAGSEGLGEIAYLANMDRDEWIFRRGRDGELLVSFHSVEHAETEEADAMLRMDSPDATDTLTLRDS